MKVQELGIEEMARTGATHRVVIKAEDFNGVGTGFGALSAASAAATAGTLTPFAALAAGVMSKFVAGFLKTAFVPASATALTLKSGYDLASGTDKTSGYQSAVSVCSGATPISFFPQEIADIDDSAADATYGAPELAVVNATTIAVNKLIQQNRKAFAVANTVQVVLTSTTANLTDFVGAGEVHLYYQLWDLNAAA
jgi:hypothetical protein